MTATVTPDVIPQYGIVSSLNGWPYPLIGNIRRAGSRAWVEVTPEHYDEMLNVLPPAMYFSGGFMMGEEADADARGVPIYTAFVRVRGGRCFARDCTKAGLTFALHDLTAALSASSPAPEGVRS